MLFDNMLCLTMVKSIALIFGYSSGWYTTPCFYKLSGACKELYLDEIVVAGVIELTDKVNAGAAPANYTSDSQIFHTCIMTCLYSSSNSEYLL